jgi:hypothetical protein
VRAVICDGCRAGSIASFPAGGQAEVTTGIDRAAWGTGIAARTLALLLELVAAGRCLPVQPATTPAHSVPCKNAASQQPGTGNRSKSQ